MPENPIDRFMRAEHHAFGSARTRDSKNLDDVSLIFKIPGLGQAFRTRAMIDPKKRIIPEYQAADHFSGSPLTFSVLDCEALINSIKR